MPGVIPDWVGDNGLAHSSLPVTESGSEQTSRRPLSAVGRPSASPTALIRSRRCRFGYRVLSTRASYDTRWL